MDPQFATPSLSSDRHDAITILLSTARSQISQGNPTLALQAVITALKASGGEGAVLQTLARARDTYRNRMRANAAADELASLFAECAIVEADSSVVTNSFSQPFEPPVEFVPHPFDSEPADAMDSSTGGSSGGAPILAESGRLQIVLDASLDGSSFICLQCGGLVSKLRRDEHIAYWCSHTPS